MTIEDLFSAEVRLLKAAVGYHTDRNSSTRKELRDAAIYFGSIAAKINERIMDVGVPT